MPAGATTQADIRSSDWSLMLDSTAGGNAGAGIGNAVQGLADVAQCLKIICLTQKGSDPLRPTFGADLLSLLDLPIDAVTAAAVAEFTDAILTWEPRAKLIALTVTPILGGSQGGSQVTLTILWQLNVDAPAPVQTTIVIIPLSGGNG